jgi:hypothetical protein
VHRCALRNGQRQSEVCAAFFLHRAYFSKKETTPPCAKRASDDGSAIRFLEGDATRISLVFKQRWFYQSFFFEPSPV